ncbi:MAG TPA: metallophosphoesterase [Candidatus Acetothermia bacterium]|nr:metallophosphoesterase [Candidatus Acetothermia bacterium]
MKIGIISDTHDNMPKIAAAARVFNEEKVDLVLHAGDIISPITANEFSALKAPFIGVFGNNDGERLYLAKRFKNIGPIYPDHHEFEFEGKHGVMMHEPKFIDALVKSAAYDLIIYGHTHEIDIREGKTLVINPGEACGWISGRATAVVLDTGTMRPRVIDI